MDSQSKVSVIIPTYNRLSLLKKAIESVLTQTYTNFEIVVIDDGSSDGTREYLLSLNDPRIKSILLYTNRGPNAARNAGIRKAEGRYIAFLDDDDEWLSDKLEKQVNIFKHNNIGIVYSAAIISLKNENIEYETTPEAKGKLFNELLLSNVIGSTSTVILRSELLSKHGMFNEKMPSMEDYELWLRLSKHTEVDFVKEPLIIYGCTTKKDSVSKNVQSNIQAFSLISKLYEKEICVLAYSLKRKRVGGFNATIGLKYLYSYRRVSAAKHFIIAFFLTFSFKFLIASLLSLISPKLLFFVRSKIRTRVLRF